MVFFEFLKLHSTVFAKQEGGGKVASGAAVGGSCAKSGSHSQHRDPSEALN